MRFDLSLFYTELSRPTSSHFGEGIVYYDPIVDHHQRVNVAGTLGLVWQIVPQKWEDLPDEHQLRLAPKKRCTVR